MASRAAVALVALAVIVVPAALALSSRHLGDGPALLVLSTTAGALAVSALALQPLLVVRLHRAAATHRRRVRAHRALGGLTLALVLVHLGTLFAIEVQDTLFALSPDGPTRARMALMGTVALIAIVAVGLLRGRLPRQDSSWRTLHAFLALLVVALGVGHAILTDGAMDGAGTVVLAGLAAVALAGIAFARLQSARAAGRSA